MDGDRVSCFAPLTGYPRCRLRLYVRFLFSPRYPRPPHHSASTSTLSLLTLSTGFRFSSRALGSCTLLPHCPLPHWFGSIALVSILRNYSHTSKISRRSWFRSITIEIISLFFLLYCNFFVDFFTSLSCLGILFVLVDWN